jgi:O-antigen/teichoic acid export membrane protein
MVGLTILLFAVGIPFFFFPEFIVQLVLGEKWLAVVPAIPWLVAAGILHGLSNQSYTVLIAKQQYFAMNVHRTLVVVAFVPLLYYFGQQYGLSGAAACVFFARLLSLPFIAGSVWRSLKS